MVEHVYQSGLYDSNPMVSTILKAYYYTIFSQKHRVGNWEESGIEGTVCQK